MNPNEEKKLYDCLSPIIREVKTILTQLKNKHESTAQRTAGTSNTSNDLLFENAVQNTNVHSFTVDLEEEELLNRLTTDIQNILKSHLPNLSRTCGNYLEQFLHEYHFDRDKRVFTQGLTANILYTFDQNLNGLFMSAQAYPAAYKGDLATVQKFLKLYPNYKDKSGFWGTTLLWSAARSAHLDVVKYLIESMGCSVNAQNQVEISYALIADDDTDRIDNAALDYNPDPKLGSTALHAACYIGNLAIVKYLIHKGADYFLRNQAGDTPIHDGEQHQEIRKFFEEYLVLNYINNPEASVPYEPILECHDRKPIHCVWEYKPVKGVEWYEFTMTEHLALSSALQSPAAGRPFEFMIYLKAAQSTYTIQLLTFLRSAKNQDPKPSPRESQAWIRCRGSSIANFDIHCFWQLMLVCHPDINEVNKSAPPSLESITIPSIYDSKFQLKLHTWYTADSELNDILNETMNYRRRCVEMDCKYIGTVTCDLYAFTFANTEKTIVGFLRWLPKYIANTSNQQDIIKELDNFGGISQFNPIPLTTKHLEKYLRAKPSTVDSRSVIIESNEDDDADIAATYDDGNIDVMSTFKSSGTWSLQDICLHEVQDTVVDDTENHSGRESYSLLSW